MRLVFKESKLEELRRKLSENPDAVSVVLTPEEALSIYDELIQEGDSNCIFLYSTRKFYMNGSSYKVVIK